MTFVEEYQALVKIALREDEKKFADALWDRHDGGSASEFYGSLYDIIAEFIHQLKSEEVIKAARDFANRIVDVGGIVSKEYELSKGIRNIKVSKRVMNLIKALESNKRYREVDDKSSFWRDPTEQILFTREAVLADYEIDEEKYSLTRRQVAEAITHALAVSPIVIQYFETEEIVSKVMQLLGIKEFE